MANIIPPLVSDSPPPPPSEDEEDDEFDDFRESNDLSYGCDSFSITSSPEQSPKKVFKEEPSSKHNSELHFDSGTPKAIITNSKEEIQIDDSKAKENDVYFLEENIKELSISETSSTSNHILFKNNFVNKDLDVHFKENIPSQLILENKICDNSDIINDINPVVLNDDTSKKFNLLNNHTESTTQQDSIDVSQNIENNFNLKSTNIENIQGNTSLYETSKNGDGVTTDVCSNSINNDEVFEKFLLNKKHSKTVPIVENPNLVKENKKHSTVNLDNDNSESNSENEAFKSDLNFKNEDSHSASFECDFNNSEIECCSNKELGNTFNSNTNDSPNNSSEIIGDSPLDIANKKLNNNTDDFENFTMFVSANEEMPDSNSDFKECVKNNLETTTTTTDDEFANFATFFPTAEEKEDDSSKESSNEVGDFAEFVPLSVQSNLSGTTEKAEDNFATSSSLKSGPFNLDESDDEFGDFGDFTSSSFDSQNQQASSVPTSKTNYPLLNQQEAFKKAQEIIKDMFDPVEEDLNGFQYVELVKEDFIFNQIQDITDTAALSYHWSKSASQKMLLKSLNIDSRNILYSGHSWNPSMPRFAANLGVQPLEPVKMEPSTTSTAPVAQANFQSEIETQDIPKAEFDWTNSGLVNPLDCAPGGSTNLDDSKSDFQTDHFQEFSSFQSSEPSQPASDWPNVPLRETYISDVTQSHINVDVYLQPTIVTPELPRKLLGTDEEPAFAETSVGVKSIDSNKDDNVEFDDFQIGTPIIDKNTEYSEINEPDENNIPQCTSSNKSKGIMDKFADFKDNLEDMAIQSSKNTNISAKTSHENTANEYFVLGISEIPKKSLTDISQNDLFADTTSVLTSIPSNLDTFLDKTNSNIEATKKIESVELQDDKYTENEDDDFTEFHSSVPLPQSKPPIAMPVLQPLKPTVVYSNAPSSQINWPDPGITDDDIRKFEEAFATPIVLQNPEKPKKEPNVEVNVSNANAASSHLKKTANVAPRTEFPMWDTSPVHQLHKKLESKKVDVRLTPTTADEDEWSEFVSVAKPSPVHRAKQSDRNQTSSPDLTLSVLNLGSIQPAKQPIPVITPQGLVQTRLSSNTNTTSHHKSNFIIPKQLPQSQPSIISNQFASQAYNFSKNFTQSSTQLPNQKSSQTIGILGAKAQEDDEWGEFVSSPLPPHLKNSNTTVNHSWNNFVLNPGQEIKRANSVVQKKNGNQVPSLVLPELDFLALKEQTGVHKKK